MGSCRTSMLRSHDSGQNMVSTDQYHSTVSRTEVSTHRGRVFFEFIRWQVTCFQMIAGSSLCFKKFIWNMLCLCRCPTLLRYCCKTDLGRKNSASYLKIQAGKTFFLPWLRVGHALRQIFMLLLDKIWQESSCGKFMQHLESCLLWQLKLPEFCVNLLFFLTFFINWMYKMKCSSY